MQLLKGYNGIVKKLCKEKGGDLVASDILTVKQERYIQGLVAGLTQREAYKRAYNASNMQGSTIDEKASRLLSQGKLRARYKELLEASSARALWTREDSFKKTKWLLDQTEATIINQQEVRQSTGTVYLQAIDKLDDLAYRDYELADKKLRLEIQKLEKQITGETAQDDKLADYITMLKDAISSGDGDD